MMADRTEFKRVEDLPEFDNHEATVFFSDKKTGLRSFVAIHSTALGPATGGTRCFEYHSELDALRDALRLSRSMTYKCALAKVPFGGGKGVIVLSPGHKKSSAVLRAYARRIHTLAGNFSTGEDVGLTESDVMEMEKITPHINGTGKVGELSPWAALGVFSAMRASLKEMFGTPSFENRTFAIKGVGKVGSALCDLIYKDGGKIVIGDIDQSKVKKIAHRYPGVRVVSAKEIHRQKVDIYAPCAMGNEFQLKTVSEVKARIICGAANNQLVTPAVGIRMHEKGILYVPDYVANAGGLINAVAHLVKGGYKEVWVRRKVEGIEKTTCSLIELSKGSRQPLSVVADRLAQQILSKQRK